MPILKRRHSRCAAKNRAKPRTVTIMKFIGDVGDRHGRLCQQAFCFFHPQMRNILIRRREATLLPLALKRSIREAVLARQHSPIRRLFEILLKIGYDSENLPESVRLGIRFLLVCQKRLVNEPPAEHIDPINDAELLKMKNFRLNGPKNFERLPVLRKFTENELVERSHVHDIIRYRRGISKKETGVNSSSGVFMNLSRLLQKNMRIGRIILLPVDQQVVSSCVSGEAKCESELIENLFPRLDLIFIIGHDGNRRHEMKHALQIFHMNLKNDTHSIYNSIIFF
ncbi:MAG: hypothetical protein L6W00_06155 [Lentisphaeria bacterium]|nr:MAG: hypothetical protein L6W00_06155 [Lentisphaeria bacterium]